MKGKSDRSRDFPFQRLDSGAHWSGGKPVGDLFRPYTVMRISPKIRPVIRILAIPLVLYVILVAVVYFRQRSMLFFPTHDDISPTTLVRWRDGNRTIGYCREVPHPRTIWLMTHGNAGQAANRDYVLQCMAEQDSLYVLEYPGYGSREGSPSRESMNQAASQAFRLLRSRNPNTPVCVLGESIGTGAA